MKESLSHAEAATWAPLFNKLSLPESRRGSFLVEGTNRYYGTTIDGLYIGVAKELWTAAANPDKQYADLWDMRVGCPYVEKEVKHTRGSMKYGTTHDDNGLYVPEEDRWRYDNWFGRFLVKRNLEGGEKPSAKEKRLERDFGKSLFDQGIQIQYQVQCEHGIADIVTPDAIYEIKASLTRSTIHKACTQVLVYKQCINPSAKAFIVGCAHKNLTSADIAIAECLGVGVIVLEDKEHIAEKKQEVVESIVSKTPTQMAPVQSYPKDASLIFDEHPNYSRCYQCGSLHSEVEIFEGTMCIDCFQASAVGCYFVDGDFICLTETASQFAIECGHESGFYAPSVLRSIWKHVTPVVEADEAGKSIMPYILAAKDDLLPMHFHRFLHHHHVGWGPDGHSRIDDLTINFPEMRDWRYSEAS